MARINKPGLNYFPLDVDFLNDRTIRKIMRKHGSTTASALIAIYSCIYKDKGYYLKWDEDTCFDISELILTDTDNLEGVVHACLEADIFCKELFDKYHILTSESIQSQYQLCTQRRKSNSIEEKYNLIPNEIPVDESTVESDSCILKSDNADSLPLNVDRGTQSKVKEKKENKTSSLPFSESGEGDDGRKPEGREKNSVPEYCFNPATHNYTGLLERLQAIGVKDQKEIDTILRLSDYGRIGEKVWKLIAYGNWPRGNIIKLPGRYLISQLRKN